MSALTRHYPLEYDAKGSTPGHRRRYRSTDVMEEFVRRLKSQKRSCGCEPSTKFELDGEFIEKHSMCSFLDFFIYNASTIEVFQLVRQIFYIHLWIQQR